MPRTLSWLDRIVPISRTVQESARSHYDRRDIERLFELHPNATGSTTAAAPGQQAANVLAEREEGATQVNGEELAAASPGGKAGGPAALQSVSAQRSPSTTTNTDPIARYDFDGYQGRLYRVFEGTVFEGVVTNHIDGGLAGPMIVMLAYVYSVESAQHLSADRLILTGESSQLAGQQEALTRLNPHTREVGIYTSDGSNPLQQAQESLQTCSSQRKVSPLIQLSVTHRSRHCLKLILRGSDSDSKHRNRAPAVQKAVA